MLASMPPSGTPASPGASAAPASYATGTDPPSTRIEAFVGGGDGAAKPPGTGLFPATSIFYQDISSAPVDAEWSTIRAAVDALGGWGAGQIEMNYEFHVLQADTSVAPRAFTQDPDTFYDGE